MLQPRPGGDKDTSNRYRQIGVAVDNLYLLSHLFGPSQKGADIDTELIAQPRHEDGDDNVKFRGLISFLE